MDLSALIFAALKSARTANERIDNLPLPMVFKGTLGTGGTISTLPTASSENEGFVYIVITDGTYAGQSAKAGDIFVSDGSTWVLVPSADEPSVIDDSVTSTALTWSSKKISDECKVKSFTYTGNGQTSNTITIPDNARLILGIGGHDGTNQSSLMTTIIVNETILIATYTTNNGTGGNVTALPITWGTNSMTLTGTSPNAMYNRMGVDYTVYYI